jgi:hypothetical protein
MLSQRQSIPARQSYSNSPVFHRAKNTPAATHCWNRSWAVEPGQKRVASRAFHWQPVRSTKKMASMQTRSGVRGRPPPNRWVLRWTGRWMAISTQRSSGMRQSSGTGFVGMAEQGVGSEFARQNNASCTLTL